MIHTYAFNGDADGLCALQQLRLAAGAAAAATAGAAEVVEELVTGVKRDIALVGRVRGGAGDVCTVLDVSLDVNRAALAALLERGVRVRYFDHHFAGDIPPHPALEAHIDTDTDVCTSLLVDRHLGGRHRPWAIVGAFGDSLIEEASALALAVGVSPDDTARLRELGLAINYNAYGETVADLHVAPEELAEEMRRFPEPLAFAASSAAYRRIAEGFRDDMEHARHLAPALVTDAALLFVLPDAAWARRASGTLASDLARGHPDKAVAVVSPKSGAGGGYVVSLRSPRECPVAADAFCRRFPTGGGRRAAAGINHLPAQELDSFAAAFEREFRAGSSG